MISGFLITRILIASQDRPRGQALKAFYVHRALRIFPAHCLVLALAAATVGIAYLPAFVLYVINRGIFFYTWVQPAVVDAPWRRIDHDIEGRDPCPGITAGWMAFVRSSTGSDFATAGDNSVCTRTCTRSGTGNAKALKNQGPRKRWRARQDSNPRPLGS